MNPFGWMVVALPLLFSAAAWIGGDMAAAIIFIGFNIIFNLPHQYGTWRRVVVEHRLGWDWLAIGAVVAAALIAVSACAPPLVREAVLGDAFVYWGLHHLAAQHVGITRVLARRASQGAVPVSVDWWFYGGLMVATVLWIHAATTMCYTLLGTTVHLHRIPLSDQQACVVRIVSVALTAGLVCTRFGRWRAAPDQRTYELTVVVGGMIALLSPSLLAAIAGLTAMHNVHYMALVRQQQRRHGAPLRGRDALLASLYVVAVNLIFICASAAGSMLFTILVAWHYLCDARLWRPSTSPLLARELAHAS